MRSGRSRKLAPGIITAGDVLEEIRSRHEPFTVDSSVAEPQVQTLLAVQAAGFRSKNAKAQLLRSSWRLNTTSDLYETISSTEVDESRGRAEAGEQELFVNRHAVEQNTAMLASATNAPSDVLYVAWPFDSARTLGFRNSPRTKRKGCLPLCPVVSGRIRSSLSLTSRSVSEKFSGSAVLAVGKHRP